MGFALRAVVVFGACVVGACLGGETTKKMDFRVLQYNIFGRPYTVSHEGQAERLATLPSALESAGLDFDVATFCEADDSDTREAMFSAFRGLGYAYNTAVVEDYDDLSLVNGGVVIGSKWPILREDQMVYRDACTDSDCLAAKGVNYARVNKTVGGESKIFNVFATHMQAWSGSSEKAVRVEQAKQLKAFVAAQAIGPDEPVLFTGDFNIDAISESTDPTGKYGISLRPPEHESDAYRHLVETVHPRSVDKEA